MAKRALSKALSVEDPMGSSTMKCQDSHLPSITYAANTENISRLLEGWMTKKKKKVITSASTTTTSPKSSENSSTSSQMSMSASNCIMSPPPTLFGLEDYESALEGSPETTAQGPFQLLESWLFDESSVDGEEHQESFLSMLMD